VAASDPIFIVDQDEPGEIPVSSREPYIGVTLETKLAPF
jgi:hypothetical protein